MKIRAKLTLALTALALVAVAGMALGGYMVLRGRAVAQARQAFIRAHGALERSLAQSYQVLVQIGKLSYLDPVIRAVTASTDESDFGLASADADQKRLADLHDNLVDANWDWAEATMQGSFAIADYKGRIIYASAAPGKWGGDTTVLPAVREALTDRDALGAMVIAADDSRLAALGLLRPDQASGLLVLLARAEVLRGKPQACFLQLLSAKRLLGQAAEDGTHFALVADEGRADGDVPEAVLAVADTETVTTRAGDSTWIAQAAPLPGPGPDAPRIGTVVVAQDLGAALAAMIDPAVVPLVATALALLAVALAAAAALAERFTRPIVALEAAATRVAAGDLTVRVGRRFASGDELERLGSSFDHMIEGLEERERVKRTFKKYLAPDVVDYLLAHPEAQELGGARRELTVMFSDLVRFTGFAEARAPEEVVAVLNRYFTRVSERIAARGGTVDKYIGDAVMAFFGAPVPRADHAAGACLAALDHIAVVDELAASGDFPVGGVRIGLNTGELILGNIGGGGAQDYTVIGDAVNLAQRLEGANRELGTRLLASAAVIEQAGAAVEHREIDRLIVPGRNTPVTVYEILGEAGYLAANPARAAGISAYARGLVAFRDRQFIAAAGAFKDAIAAWPGDRPAAVQQARAEAFAADPPAPDPDGGWDAALHLGSK